MKTAGNQNIYIYISKENIIRVSKFKSNTKKENFTQNTRNIERQKDALYTCFIYIYQRLRCTTKKLKKKKTKIQIEKLIFTLRVFSIDGLLPITQGWGVRSFGLCVVCMVGWIRFAVRPEPIEPEDILFWRSSGAQFSWRVTKCSVFCARIGRQRSAEVQTHACFHSKHSSLSRTQSSTQSLKQFSR